VNAERTQSRRLTRTGTLGGTGTRGLSRTRTRTMSATTVAGGARAYRRARMRRWWRRTWRRVSARTRSMTRAITPLGWFVFAIGAASVVAGLWGSWIEAWFVAVVCALVLLIALPFLLGSRAYRTSLGLNRKNVIAGDDVLLTVEVQNTAARPQLPAVIELPVGDALRELTVPLLGPHHGVTLPVTVPTERRGVINVGPLTVARQDPLGMLRREMTWRDVHRVHVHPKTVLLPPNSAGLVRDLEGQASRRLTDSDLSFHAVREYVPGDAMRHIHWKSTAKTGQLMVRQYEESQTARLAVLFDARREEYASDDEFELGVSIAASISVQAVREGRERFVASAWTPGKQRPSIDGLEELSSRDPARMLDAWSELGQATDGQPIEALARSLAHSARDLSIVVLVTGSVPTMDRLRRAAISFSPDVHVLAIRAELLADPAAQRVDSLTLATIGALGDLPQLMLRGAL